MTPATFKELQALRAIEGTDLEEKRKALPTFEAAEREADAATRAATSAHREAQAILASLGRTPEEVLTHWLHERELARNEAAGRLARARAELDNVRHLIANRIRGCSQLDLLLAPADAERAA